MNDELVEEEGLTVGQRLRAAREERGLSLEDVAAQTRIPQRHLESIEGAEWDKLPAPTYTTGFAKSYASAVGLDRTEVGEQLRAELSGRRPTTAATTEVFEPADPARTMPKSLVFGAIAAVILLVLVLSWLNERSLQDSDQPTVAEATPPPPSAPAPARQQPPAAGGPVTLTATAPAWIQVTDQGRELFSGELAPGQGFTVPASATAPVLKAGKPEALRVTVGTATAPPVGTAGRVASNVSLRAADLMRGPARTGTAAAVPNTTGR
ncbi:MAG: hypothetical protein AVDCRST_MAG44-859 [uncultured Sphingomonas sp.]|uniref:HTH cro/C1-type domain-containing protein n=1 Tax=uncultured Sphingomonas sp. TaxID=158754 RepID=A0A6J4SQQ9_9SPHN|nr:MAG: hypothetical protein AVDCRST_MAG44-859 [uncultured Sphingomonas sp.]